MIDRGILCGVLALICVSCSTAPGTQRASEDDPSLRQAAIGHAFLERGDYATGAGILLPLAQAGIANAQLDMGIIYNNALGVPQDVDEAMRWYRLAAEQGHPDAMNRLGFTYQRLVPPNFEEARIWYEHASALGSLQATNNLGLLYMDRQGVPQDYAEARRQFEIAIAEGHANSMHNLGIMYQNGQGGPVDHVAAAEMFLAAIAAGNIGAFGSIGNMYAQGVGVDRDVTEAVRFLSAGAQARS